MVKNKTWDFLLRVLIMMGSAIMYAFFFKVIVEGRGFLAMGSSGLAVIGSRSISMAINKPEMESILYMIFYMVLNIPIVLFAWNKLGKRFTILSIVFVITFSVSVALIPSNTGEVLGFTQIDNMTSAVLIGIIGGCACAWSLKFGGAPGGFDVVSTYLSVKKGKSVGRYNLIINSTVLVIGLLVFKDVASIIYTLIYALFTSLVEDRYYNRNKKVFLEIVTTKKDEICTYLMNQGQHGCTILNGTGAYTNEEKFVIHTVISSFQLRQISADLSKIDKDAFISNVDINDVVGEFYIPPIK